MSQNKTNYIDEPINKEKIFSELRVYYKKLNKCGNYSIKDLEYKHNKWISDNNKLGKDKAGCYVLSYNNVDMYVGISRGIFKRIKQHISGNDNSATFKKKMREYKTKPENKATIRKEINDFPNGFKFRYVEINDNYLLAMFEIYASMKLETFWNTFKTH